MKFTYLHRNCPICQGERRDCRQAGDLILCLSDVKSAPEYKFVKPDKNNLFNIWAPDDGKPSNSNRATRRFWNGKRGRKAIKKYCKLAAGERDAQYKRITRYFELSPEHRAQLMEQRGLTPEDVLLMMQLGILTNQPGVGVGHLHLDPTLGGVWMDFAVHELVFGGKLAGILIPALFFGLTTGYQIASDDRTEGKYKWLQNCHMPNGKLPLFTWQHPDLSLGAEPSVVVYCEGGLKSLITAIRLWKIDKAVMVVGIGCGFSTLPEEIIKLRTSHILMPDAGSHLNRTIVRLYHHIYEQVGVQLLVGDWGQWDAAKGTAPDIDDYLRSNSWDSIEFRSWSEWIPPAPEDTEPNLDDQAAEEVKLNAEIESDPNYQSKQQERDQKEAEAQAAEEQRRSEDWKKQQQRLEYQHWLRLLQFTPNREVDQQYLDLDEDELLEYDIIAIRSGTGTNKSGLLTKLVKYLEDEKWLLAGSRNALLLQLIARCNRLLKKGKFWHIHDASSDCGASFSDTHYKAGSCVDSFRRAVPEHFDNVNLTMDEGYSVTLHSLFSSTIDNRPQALELLREAFVRANRIILLDANLPDWIVNGITEMRNAGRGGTSKVLKLQNNYQGSPLKIRFYQGSIGEFGDLKANDKSQTIAEILARLDAGQNIGYISDSQLSGEALERLAIERGLDPSDILRVDKKTANETYENPNWSKNSPPHVPKSIRVLEEFFEDSDKYIKKHRPRLVIFSPTVESGVDVNVRQYFDHCYCLFFGVIHSGTALQMIGRIRDPQVARTVWCREKGWKDSDFFRVKLPSQLEKIYLERAEAEIALMLRIESGEVPPSEEQKLEDYYDGLIRRQKETVWWKMYIKIQAGLNFEKENLRNCLIHRLEAAGHNIRKTAGLYYEKDADAIKEKTEEAKRQEVSDIFNGDLEILAKGAASGCYQYQCAKDLQFYLRSLPEIKNEQYPDGQDIWSEELIYQMRFADRNLLRTTELRLLLQRDNDAGIAEQWYWGEVALGYRPAPWLGDSAKKPSKAQLVEALRSLGIIEILKWDEWLTGDCQKIKDLVKRGKNRKIAKILDSPGKDGVKYLRKILGLVGVQLDDKTVQGKKHYRLDHLETPEVKAIERCINRRWDEKLKNPTTDHQGNPIEKNPWRRKASQNNTTNPTDTTAPTIPQWQHGQMYPAGTAVQIIARDPYLNQRGVTTEDITATPGLDINVEVRSTETPTWSHWLIEELQLIPGGNESGTPPQNTTEQADTTPPPPRVDFPPVDLTNNGQSTPSTNPDTARNTSHFPPNSPPEQENSLDGGVGGVLQEPSGGGDNTTSEDCVTKNAWEYGEQRSLFKPRDLDDDTAFYGDYYRDVG